MHKLILTSLVTCIACAAPWDGSRNGLTVSTATFDAGQLLGLPYAIPSTSISVVSTDATVTAFRVVIQLHNAFGQLETRAEVCNVLQLPFVAACSFLGVGEAAITAVRVVRLRDGEVEDLLVRRVVKRQ